MTVFKVNGNASKRRPSLRGILMQDVTQGAERTRVWPTKKGRRKTKAQKQREDLFAAVQMSTKYMAPQIYLDAMNAVAGTPLLTRDILTSIAYNKFVSFVQPDGRQLFPMTSQIGVSDSLDAITQTPGQMLIRRETRWEPITLDQVQGSGVLFDQTITSPVSEVVIGPLDGAAQINVYAMGLTHSGTTQLQMQVSVDGGASYINDSDDYMVLDQVGDIVTGSFLGIVDGSGQSPVYAIVNMGPNAGAPVMMANCPQRAGIRVIRNLTGRVTHARMYFGSAQITGGRIIATGVY